VRHGREGPHLDFLRKLNRRKPPRFVLIFRVEGAKIGARQMLETSDAPLAIPAVESSAADHRPFSHNSHVRQVGIAEAVAIHQADSPKPVHTHCAWSRVCERAPPESRKGQVAPRPSGDNGAFSRVSLRPDHRPPARRWGRHQTRGPRRRLLLECSSRTCGKKKNRLLERRKRGRRDMELGEPQRVILVEPLELPEPVREQETPTPQPQQIPVGVPA
jgi:hypothetical protein